MNKIKIKLKNFFLALKNKIGQVKPLSNGWKGSTIALAVITIILFTMQGYFLVRPNGMLPFIIGTIIAILVVALAAGIVTLIMHLVKKIPSSFLWVLISSLLLLYITFIAPIGIAALVVISIILLFSILGALLYKFIKGDFRNIKGIKKIAMSFIAMFAVISMFLGGFWLINDGQVSEEALTMSKYKNNNLYSSMLENPSKQGSLKVKTLTYGSENNYRKEFNKEDSLISKTVDGSAFVEKWSSLRKKNLGFGPDKMPLNGKVWYPDSQGTFPLVIIVHGNHIMSDYSDDGYEYLGQLLASKGYIFVSIDENFLNVSPYNDMFLISPIEKENPARGMVMLEHIKLWEQWSKEEGNPFYKKIDMNNIALIGHSRGGEAVAIAAAYNKLNVHPDNGNIKFDYNFNIRSIVSIAGTDKQYKPSGKLLPLKNINYLALQGSHDMDVTSFSGLMQYDRISYTGNEDYFKACIYVYGANHGQFNSTWGREDGVGLGNRLFNTKQLMTKEQQEETAKVIISSFLDATLKGETEYRKIFRDLGYAMKWLPDNLYINNYFQSNTSLISNFQEDIDITSTTLSGGKLLGENFEEWKEEKVKFKHREEDYSAVKLAWNNTKNSKIPEYSIVLPDEKPNLSESSLLVFSIADNDTKKGKAFKNSFIDLTIRLEDAKGNKAELPLSQFSPLLPMVEGKIIKKPFSNFIPNKEPIFQSFEFQLKDFKKANESFDIKQLRKISYIFNKTEKGSILIDDIGIRR